MDFLQNSGDNQTARNQDLKISKPTENGMKDCGDPVRLKIPEERVKNNSSPSSGNNNEKSDSCEDKAVSKSEQSKEEKSETIECSPSYSGATEPIDGSSPSYSGATEENVASPAKSTSPDPNCAICLGKLENKSFTDSCFHQFCFTCLLEWSKIKAECPLCKQAFKSIIHNVRSIEDYDQYYITQRNADARRSWRSPEGRRFRYPSTLTGDRRRQLEFEHSVEFQNYRLTYAPHLYRGLNNRYPSTNRSTTSDARRNIYNNNFWVVPQTNGERYRETGPDFYRENPACTHRLIPWLNRELLALLSHSENQVSFILELVLALISRYDIKSSEFYEHVFPYLRDRTTHFVHEFYHFARSPHDMQGYDRNASYELLDSANLNRESTSSSPDVVEVPVDGAQGAAANNEETRPPRPKRHFYARHFGTGLESRRRRSKTTLNRNWERFSPLNYDGNSRLRVYDLDTPGPSRQEFSLPFRPWDVSELPASHATGFGSSTQESDEECVIVNCVQPAGRRTPPIITIPSSSEGEDEAETEAFSSPTEKKNGVSYEKPATRKNRCTFHYDYSSDSCSEQTDTVSSSGASNSESKKSKIKSFIGSVSGNLAVASGSSESSSRRTSRKKHKKSKKHKHKHHRHRHAKRDKE